MKSALACTLALLALGGCAITRQAQARDSAAARTCDSHQRCGLIGPGKKFPDRGACVQEYREYWNSRWSVQSCDRKLRQDGLDLCLKAIEATDCDNVLDVLNTAFNKCAESRVCGG